MASVNFQKCKGGAAAKAIIRHCDKEKRLEASHSNESIDKTKTFDNKQYAFVVKRADGTKTRAILNYKKTCERYDERIKEIDAKGNTNLRKDRVTCFALCIPVPEKLQEKDIYEFYNQIGFILSKKYGFRNFVNCYIHFDEIHDYKDAETGRNKTSRVHAHFFFVPEKDGQLNGKWFSSRANMTEINKSIDTMCREKFGIRFMDGTKKKSRKSVEELKNESEELKKQDIEKAFRNGYINGMNRTYDDFLDFFKEYDYISDPKFRVYYQEYFNEKLPKPKNIVKNTPNRDFGLDL